MATRIYRFLPFYVKNPENKPSKGSFAAGLVFLLYHFLTKPAASAVFCLKSQEYIPYKRVRINKKGPVRFSQVLSFLIKLFSEISSSALSNNINFDLSRILHFTFDLLGDIMGH